MRFTQSFINTLRQAPANAEVISHKLLVRAGFIRQVANGIYEWLPLGLRSLRKVASAVRAELDAAGCQEVEMPHLVPAELWQESGRWQKYGKELLRIEDRHEREFCFGPTHEEVICDMVRTDLKSYRQLPINLYQIQTKFRDEVRPRFGLMRGREFLMKDGYSFHTSYEDLDREYKNMYDTYHRIFKRCGLESRAVDADTGAIGGSASHEFMVLADTGEDVIAACESCVYAANLEKAQTRFEASAVHATAEALEIRSTPGKKSVEDVASFLKITPAQMIKSLIYKVDDSYVMVCVAGNREVNDIKLNKVVSGEVVRLASDAEIQSALAAPVGYLGPVKAHAGVKILYDKSLLGIADGATGANEADAHFIHVSPVRDLALNEKETVDVSSVIAGDPCPDCSGGKLKLLRGIEVGHIFKLGTRYSLPMKVNYKDEKGQEQNSIMGTYGIGVSRVLAACVEQNHDEAGIAWPRALAPYEVVIVTMGMEEPLVLQARKIYDELRTAGFDVIWDDRDERAGVKLNDADLIGFPMQVVIGRKGLEKGEVEYKLRKTNMKGSVALSSATVDLIKILEKL